MTPIVVTIQTRHETCKSVTKSHCERCRKTAVDDNEKLEPVKALYWSAVINGLAAVPVMIVVMLMGASHRLMGQFAISGILKFGGWAATALMAVAAIGMFVPA